MNQAQNFVIKARALVAPYLKNAPTVFVVILSSLVIDFIYLTGFLSSVDQIELKYNVSFATASWTLSAYAVTYASFIAIFGRISDIVGHHIMLGLGLFAFSALSIVTALVQNIYVLIVFRAFQGICAAATVPPSFGIVAHTFSGKALKIALGVMNALMISSFGIGLIVGGALTNTWIGYRGLCWLAAGYSLIAGILAVLIVDPIKGDHTASLKRLDYFGVFLLATGGVLVVTGFTEAGSDWSTPSAYVPIIIGTLTLIAFILWETLFFRNGRGESVSMMIPKVMWTVRNFKPIPIITFLLYAGFMAAFLSIDQYFEYVYGNSALIAAVRILPFVLIMVVTTTSFVFIPPDFFLSARVMCVAGIAVGLAGLILISQADLGASNTYWRYYFPGLILFGGGTNFYFVNYLNMIVLATPLEMQALVSGICLTMGQMGAAIGMAVTTSILGNSNVTVTDKGELSDIYKNAYYFGVAGYAAGLILIFIFVKNLRPDDIKQTRPKVEESGEASPEEGEEPEKASVEEVASDSSSSSNSSNVV